ncbi:MAG: AAA family ATPase [Thermodesulfobacteriota bacterium]
MLISSLEKRYQDFSDREISDIEIKAKDFQKIFSLTDDEVSFCLFFFLLVGWDHLENYFRGDLEITKYSGRKYLKTVLDIPYSRLEDVIRGKLNKIGIVSKDKRHAISFDDDFLHLFMDPRGSMSSGSLYKKVDLADLPLEYHQITEEKLQYLKSLLSEKSELPAHVILYGPPGTGKTSFAKALANSLPDPAYEIIHDNENTSDKRRAGIQACLNLTNIDSGSIILVDEADNLISTRGGFFARGEVKDKGWLNSFMEEPGARIIWIVNDVDDIEESVLRRFSYSLYFPKFSRDKRAILWKNILKHNKAGRLIKDKSIQDLARDYEVSPGVIDLAVKQALKARSSKKLNFLTRVRLALDAHVQLQHQGMVPEVKSTQARETILDGLNISENYTHLFEQLHLFEKKRNQKDSNGIYQFNLLFYGPPGTGKSEFAKYISKELDRDLVIKRASDLLNPYVGMTESNIAQMFAEAETKGAVLVIDEADSFIYGRDIARHSWEVGHVNEFLTQMENFKGILICTTNRFQNLDQASIRRFNQKIFFDYLSEEGNQIFFEKILQPLARSRPTRDETDRLKRMKNLTPGDYKNIYNKFALTPGKISITDLINALEKEQMIKDSHSQDPKIGF